MTIDLGCLVTVLVHWVKMSVDRIMYFLECLEQGIIPPPEGDHGSLIESPAVFMEQLSPEERRKAKRKFRKLYRKFRKKRIRELELMRTKSGRLKASHGSRPLDRARRDRLVNAAIQDFDGEFGKPGENPRPDQLRARRDLVMKEIWQKTPKLK
jgi:hypothetical protein